MDSPLARPVAAFIDVVAPVLIELVAGLTPTPSDASSEGRKLREDERLDDKLLEDTGLEALNLVAAFIDSDGRHTDDELWAFVHVFAGRFDTVARAASPDALRSAGLLTGRRAFLDAPSALFDVLLRADVRSGTDHAWRYYLGAVDIAHAVFSLDDYPSHAELTSVERFRSLLLQAMDTAGVSRPGGPVGVSRPGGPVGAPRHAGAVAGPAAAPPTVAEAPPTPARPLEEVLAELEGLVGLAPVKAEVKLVTNLLRVEKLRTERGLPVVGHSRHLVFTGNPGTGKTTVARMLAEIYRVLGVVEKGQLIETDRSGLVAGYIGQTSIKVKEVFASALGGVLLIDEAHALARGEDRDFGHEAIDMIVKLMEDHRDEVVLIVAGYPAEMAAFLDANPGLRSRFPKTIFFDDYSTEELGRIFDDMAVRAHYTPTEEARKAVQDHLASRPRTQGFGNARLVRNLFEAAVANQASRVVQLAEVTDEALVALESADIPAPEQAAPGIT